MSTEIDGDSIAELGAEFKSFFPSRDIVKSYRNWLASFVVGVGTEALYEAAL